MPRIGAGKGWRAGRTGRAARVRREHRLAQQLDICTKLAQIPATVVDGRQTPLRPECRKQYRRRSNNERTA